MSDIIFKCTSCRKSLSIPESGAGKEVECVSCQCFIKVPTPDYHFECEVCNSKLAVCNKMQGVLFGCPMCENNIIIPRNPNITTAELENLEEEKTSEENEEKNKVQRKRGQVALPVIDKKSEYMKRAQKKLMEGIDEIQERERQKRLKPYIVTFKIIVSLLICWLAYFLLTLVVPTILAKGFVMLAFAILFPLFYKAKLLVGDD